MSNSTACRLLVSANTFDECKLLWDLQVPWIDLKDPREGPLGRPSIEHAVALASMMSYDPKSFRPWSFAGGELSDWDNHRDWQLIEALGVDGHIKFGLAGCRELDQWMDVLSSLVGAMHRPQQAILVHYADASLVDAPSWENVLEAANALGTDQLLIDTAIKDGTTLTDLLTTGQLAKIIDSAHDLSLKIALAGSIPLHELSQLRKLNPDWIGIRGAVCSNPKNRNSLIDPDLVLKALELMDRNSCNSASLIDPVHSF
jgi:uncharacterized protein (UPF0264 family)